MNFALRNRLALARTVDQQTVEVFRYQIDHARHKPGKDDRDLFQLHLGGIIANSMGAAVAANVSSYIYTVDGADICRVHVHASGFPVDAKVTIDKNGQMIKRTAFYVRASNATRELDDREKVKYILGRWPTRSSSPESKS